VVKDACSEAGKELFLYDAENQVKSQSVNNIPRQNFCK
jgi:hypothetical protein